MTTTNIAPEQENGAVRMEHDQGRGALDVAKDIVGQRQLPRDARSQIPHIPPLFWDLYERRKKSVGMTIDVSPEIAGDWLMRNVINRPASPHTVTSYANRMRAGIWQETGESVIFAANGDLLNGQHRLLAVIQANVTVPILVTIGVPAESFVAMDQGRKRSGADVLAIMGEENFRSLSSALAIIIRNERGQLFNLGGLTPSLTNEAIVEALDRHPEIRESMDFWARQQSKIISKSMGAAFHYLFSRKDRQMADTFMEKLATGENLSSGDPILLLRDRILEGVGITHGRTRAITFEYIVRSWNAYRQGRTLKRLQLGANKATLTIE